MSFQPINLNIKQVKQRKMIKANELRIGNWFYDGCTDRNGNLVPATVKAITETIEPDVFLEPIPLTPEILEKSGFKAKGSGWYTTRYFTDCNEAAEVMRLDINVLSGRCAIYDEDNGAPAMTGKVIKYLHQLQNAFYALTGEELEFTP